MTACGENSRRMPRSGRKKHRASSVKRSTTQIHPNLRLPPLNRHLVSALLFSQEKPPRETRFNETKPDSAWDLNLLMVALWLSLYHPRRAARSACPMALSNKPKSSKPDQPGRSTALRWLVAECRSQIVSPDRTLEAIGDFHFPFADLALLSVPFRKWA